LVINVAVGRTDNIITVDIESVKDWHRIVRVVVCEAWVENHHALRLVVDHQNGARNNGHVRGIHPLQHEKQLVQTFADENLNVQNKQALVF
jgi:hypothetical protein